MCFAGAMADMGDIKAQVMSTDFPASLVRIEQKGLKRGGKEVIADSC